MDRHFLSGALATYCTCNHVYTLMQEIQFTVTDMCKVEKESGAHTSAVFCRTVEALYPSCRSIASAAFRLATFLLGPVPVATSLFTLTCMCTRSRTSKYKINKTQKTTKHYFHADY